MEAAINAALSNSSSSSADVRGLVYAIGSIPLKPLKSTTYQDFLDTYNVNFASAALAIKAAAPALTTMATTTKRPSSIVLFSSIAASLGFPIIRQSPVPKELLKHMFEVLRQNYLHIYVLMR